MTSLLQVVVLAAVAVASAVGSAAERSPPCIEGEFTPITATRLAACPPGKAWHAHNGTTVKIPAAAVRGDQLSAEGWSTIPVPGTGEQAIVWGVNKCSHATLKPGQGVLTYTARVPADGRYRWSALMAAPHSTEYNDFWVHFTNGVYTQMGGKVFTARGKWIKIYSNRGDMKTFAWSGRAVDFERHQVLTPELKAGQTLEFRISGRSNRVAIAAFGLFKCGPENKGENKNSTDCPTYAKMCSAQTSTCG